MTTGRLSVKAAFSASRTASGVSTRMPTQPKASATLASRASENPKAPWFSAAPSPSRLLPGGSPGCAQSCFDDHNEIDAVVLPFRVRRYGNRRRHRPSSRGPGDHRRRIWRRARRENPSRWSRRSGYHPVSDDRVRPSARSTCRNARCRRQRARRAAMRRLSPSPIVPAASTGIGVAERLWFLHHCFGVTSFPRPTSSTKVVQRAMSSRTNCSKASTSGQGSGISCPKAISRSRTMGIA